jgi:DNA-binding SARP family transcriptional activator
MTTFNYCLLGPMRAVSSTDTIRVAYPQRQIILGSLLLTPGRPVPLPVLIDRIWPDSPPASARNIVYSHITALRLLLHSTGADLERDFCGYRVTVTAAQVDLHRFRTTVSAVSNWSSDPDTEAARLASILAMYEGTPFDGLHGAWIDGVRGAVNAERLAVQIRLNTVWSKLGRHDQVLAQLYGQCSDNPLNETLVGQLASALARSGRRADALLRLRDFRRRMVAELGIEPDTEVGRLYQLIASATGPD